MTPLIIAFAMYSRIPMPRVDWSEKNMRYAMCFFPVIGIVIAAAEYLCFLLCGKLALGTMFRSILLVLIPILITGGIHMDGFMDTMDALSSHAERERKLEILKDSHTGAFAILGCCVYLLAAAAVWSEVTEDMLLAILPGFVISRALSGIAVVSWKSARKNGLLYTFADGAHKIVVRTVLAVCLAAAAVFTIGMGGSAGAAAVAAAALVFLYYRLMSLHQFGGITGDLAGYFLQLCELAIPLAAVFAVRIGGVL